MDRRTFLKILAATGIASFDARRTKAENAPISKERMPLRMLGRSGDAVSLIGLGGFHIGWTTEELAQATIEAALEEGVRFFDTAESYNDGHSEERYGRYLTPKYRDEIFLMSKTGAPDAATAEKHLSESLRRLKTDRLDLWQIHALQSPADVDARIKNGVVDFALKAKASGKVRHLGFTGHSDPAAHRRMLERFPGQDVFLTAQMPVNPVDMVSPHSFIQTVLPTLIERHYGILAMKSLADGHFFAKKVVRDKVSWETPDPIVPNTLSLKEVVHFVLSLPVTTLIVGAEKPEYLRDKVAIARRYQAMKAAERQQLADKVRRFAEIDAVEYYKSRS